MDSIERTRFELYKILTSRFNDEELRTLCFALTVDYDSLQGNEKSAKARELIAYLERRDDIPQFIEIGKQLRPDISWPNAIKSTTYKSSVSEHPSALHIMVTGGRYVTQEIRHLAFLVGQQVVLRKHTLLSNGSKGVDEASCEGALAACRSSDLNPNIKIQIFRPRTAPTPYFDFGNLQIVGTSYDERRNFVVQRSDAIILLGGGSGTNHVARQCRIMEKPIVPIGIGKRDETSVSLWYQMGSTGRDDLPLIRIKGEDLQKIGPGQQDFGKVSLAAILLAEKLIHGKAQSL